jgi:threonine/homoserine/homoserine lactone efflux protein
MNVFASMSAFALAMSISPGPVNLVALAGGFQYGFLPSMRHVTGATVGFTALLVMTGIGVHELVHYLPSLIAVVRWAGAAFLLYMAYKLTIDDGQLGTKKSTKGPAMLSGAAMQWLNPKAWLASLAGTGAYAANGPESLVWKFAALYFVICYLSITCWAAAGLFLRQYLSNPKRVRMLNRTLALLLVFSTYCLLQE